MAETPIIILSIVRDAKHFTGKSLLLWLTGTVCARVGVCVLHTRTRTQPHSYIPMVCTHMYDGIESCVFKYTSTHTYCESKRKYLSVVYASSMVYSYNPVCCLTWVTVYNVYFYIGSAPPTPKQIAGGVYVRAFLSLLWLYIRATCHIKFHL